MAEQQLAPRGMSTLKKEITTLTTANGNHLVQGIQLRERALVPKWFGRFVLWMFFHRTDTANTITITGLSR
jgi:hypothetical protein